MLIEDKLELKMNNRNIKHYRHIGFDVKMGDIIEIKTSQLSSGAHNKVRIKCDYCGDIFKRVYKDYFNSIYESPIKKDACKKCRGKKTKESNLLVYGVESIRHIDEVNEKIKSTNIERYGTDNPLGNKEIKEKATKTTIKRYGVDNFFKVDNFKNIQEESMLKKYGYKHFSEDDDKLIESLRKRNITMYQNMSAPSSRQQNYIHEIIGGELNYPVGKCMLDIAFPKEMIYLEYQGSGHALDVKMGKLTESEFSRREMSRYYFLKKQGWKMIEIVSNKDLLPSKEDMLSLLKTAKELLQDSSYVGFFLDDNKIKYKKEMIDFEFTLENPFSRSKQQIIMA